MAKSVNDLPPMLREAQAKTMLVFEVFLRVQPENKLPVHGKEGIPKPDNCMGYAAVWDKLVAEDMVQGQTAIYMNIAATDAGLDWHDLAQVFVENYREPATKAEAIKASAGTRLYLADMKRRGYRPATPLTPDGLPAPAWQVAYAAVHESLRQSAKVKTPAMAEAV